MPALDKLSNKIGEKWNRPLKENNLKIWIPNLDNNYRDPSIGIGLGTKNKPNIFSFAILNNDSIKWFENTLKASKKIVYENNKNKSKSNSDDDNDQILWLKKRDVNKLKNIYISLLVVKKRNKISIRLIINSKSSLSEELNSEAINWIIETLNVAKYTFDGALQNE